MVRHSRAGQALHEFGCLAITHSGLMSACTIGYLPSRTCMLSKPRAICSATSSRASSLRSTCGQANQEIRTLRGRTAKR